MPSLLPYYGNRLAIGTICRGTGTWRPRSGSWHRRSGAGRSSSSRHRQSRAATGTVLIEAGGKTRPPAFGQLRVTVQGQPVESPIGKQREFYLEDVPPGRYEAVIEWEGEPCRFTLEIPAFDEAVLKLGTLRCSPSARPPF